MSVIQLNREFEGVQLHRVGDSSVWECAVLRVTKVGDQWEAEVPLRPMLESAYNEYCPTEVGGRWTKVGLFDTQVAAMRYAFRLKAKTEVWRAPYQNQHGLVPAALVSRIRAQRDLDTHSAPRGAGF